MKVAIYTRVSTNDGRQTIENQTADLERYAASRGWEIVAQFSDQASGSGKKARPGYEALFAAAHRHEFDIVLVWKLDRFTREGMVKAVTAIQRLADAGVRFHSYTEPIMQTTGPQRDLLIALFGFFAAYERELMKERIKAGIARAKANGKHCGRRPNQEAKEAAIRLRQEGHSLSDIAGQLGVRVSVVCRYLKQNRAA